MSAENGNLDIAIIGAGISGLATAICLRRTGHRVTVFERSGFKNEVGAAINMPPHAVKILRAWDLAGPNPNASMHKIYTDKASGKQLSGSRRLDPKTTEVVQVTSFEGDEDIYGACFVSYHRADLHAELRSIAEEAGTTLMLGTTAIAIECEDGLITYADTQRQATTGTVQKDLIILADGINTTFANDVSQTDVPLIDTGRSAYRTLIPTSRLLADQDAKVLFNEGGEHGLTGTASPQTGVFMLAYPCRNGELMSVTIFHKAREEDKSKEDWNAPATIEQAIAALEGFHPAWKAVIQCADSVKVYRISHRDPLPRYVNGRAIVIGDAAHPMLPTIAGGGSTALEDAAALEILLKDLTSNDARPERPLNGDTATTPGKSILAKRLTLWEALRLPRDATTQVLSTALLAPKPANEFAADVRRFYSGPLPEQRLAGWSKATKDFILPYDVYRETQTALEWAEANGYPDDMMGRIQAEGVVRHFG